MWGEVLPSPQSPQFMKDWSEDSGFESGSQEGNFEDSVLENTLQIGEIVIDMPVDDGTAPTIPTPDCRAITAPALSQKSMQDKFGQSRSTLPRSADEYSNQSSNRNKGDIEKQQHTA